LDTDQNTNSHAHRNSAPYTYSHFNSHGYPDADKNAHRNSATYSHSDANQNTNADANSGHLS
jgi:hypothetical protein